MTPVATRVHNGAGTTATPKPETETKKEMPSRFFWIAFAYLIALLALFSTYHLSADFRDALPASIGALPIGVPWFGALGGAMISLSGTFLHRFEWDHKFDYWHYARPWVGAVIGSVGVVILLAVVDASTTAVEVDGLALYVIAFIVGYREKTFRDLIAKAADVLLSPGGKAEETEQRPT